MRALSRPQAPLAPLALVAGAIVQAAAEAFPRARQRRRLAATLAAGADRLAATGNVLSLGEPDPQVGALARAQAAAALREVLGELPATLGHSAVAAIGKLGVRPLRAPQSGAEAVMCASTPADARQRLTRALAALDELREQVCDLAQTITEQLDRIDGEPDFEDDELEAGLGSVGIWNGQALPDEAEGDEADDEPWLAAPEGAQSYAARAGGGQDLELDCEDEGAQCDDEGDQGGDSCSWRSGEVDQSRLGRPSCGRGDYGYRDGF